MLPFAASTSAKSSQRSAASLSMSHRSNREVLGCGDGACGVAAVGLKRALQPLQRVREFQCQSGDFTPFRLRSPRRCRITLKGPSDPPPGHGVRQRSLRSCRFWI